MSFLRALANVTIDLVGEQFSHNFASYQDGVYRKKSPPNETVTRATYRAQIGSGIGGAVDAMEGLGEFIETLWVDGPSIETLAAELTQKQIADINPDLRKQASPSVAEFWPPSFGALLDKALQSSGTLEQQPTFDQEVAAAILLRAAVRAGKFGNQLPPEKRGRIMDGLYGLGETEQNFVQREFDAPDDPATAKEWCPDGFAPYVYLISLVAADFKSNDGKQYIDEIQSFLQISEDDRNRVASRFGGPLR